MTYIIAEPCIDIKDLSCVDVCPVDCIHEFNRILIIDPEECIDCGACEPECPVEAIFPEDALPEKWEPFVKINYAYGDGADVDQYARRRIRDRAQRPEPAARDAIAELAEPRPGLLRWTARHPEWRPPKNPGDPADWPPDVGSVAYEAADAFLLVDPLVPVELWGPLQTRIERHGQPVVVYTTIRFHRRSRDEVVRRFGATATRRAAELPTASRRSGSSAPARRCSGCRARAHLSRATGCSATTAAGCACARQAGFATCSRA